MKKKTMDWCVKFWSIGVQLFDWRLEFAIIKNESMQFKRLFEVLILINPFAVVMRLIFYILILLFAHDSNSS